MEDLDQELTTFLADYCDNHGMDGSAYFFLKGPDLQEGVAGFGNSPSEAAFDFIKNLLNGL